MLTFKCKDTGSELELDEIEISENEVSKESLKKIKKICNENNLNIEIEICKFKDKYAIFGVTLTVNNVEIISSCIYPNENGKLVMYNS